jgi:hypothetical protein
MSTWSALASVILSQLVFVVLLKYFPDFLNGALLKRVEHGYNVKLEAVKSELQRNSAQEIERSKAELQAAYSTIKSSVDFLSTGQTALRERSITSVEMLWGAMLQIKDAFSDVVYLDTILLPNEIDELFQGTRQSSIFQSVSGYPGPTNIFAAAQPYRYAAIRSISPGCDERLGSSV